MIGADRRRLALCSGGVRTPERLAALQTTLHELFAGCRRVLFVPWALADHDGYLRQVEERGFGAGFALEGLHRASDPIRAVEEAEAIYVGGGNSFRLLAAVQRAGLIEPLRRRVLAGTPYLGISAGTNLACPTIRTTNDMPIVEPSQGLGALGLVPFQINPHFFDGRVLIEDSKGVVEPHCGETRVERIQEFLEENSIPVLGMYEGAILRCRFGEARMKFGRARLFQAAGDARDFAHDADLDFLWDEARQEC